VGTAARGEFYSFQLGVWAARNSLTNLRVQFGDLRDQATKRVIPASAFRCFNFGGVDWEGHSFSRTVNVAEGKVQPIWCGVQIPTDAVAGQYSATVVLSADGHAQTPIKILLSVNPALIRNAGDDDPQRLSRLRWLDSTLAEDDGIVPPYTAVQIQGRKLGVLGRDLLLGDVGLPKAIGSHFSIEMTGYTALPRQVLSAPIRMVIEDTRHHILPWSPGRLHFTKKSEGAVAWEVPSQVGPLSARLRGEIEFDGSLNYTIDLTARAATNVADIRLEIPFAADVARYAMGLGLRGGTRPDHYEHR
jgi:hypothetical protein